MIPFKRKKPEVIDVSYDPKSAKLRAYTTAKKAELGILYTGERIKFYEHPYRPATAFGQIYYFEKEEEFDVNKGQIEVKVEPFYGGFLSKKKEGICYIRCVRLDGQIHIAPICCLNLSVEPKSDYVAMDGIELRLEGGEILKGSIHSDRRVDVRICRINTYMQIKIPEKLLSAEMGEFLWKPLAVERSVVVFGNLNGKKIVKTFRLNESPYVLSDITYASNRIALEVEWGKLTKKRTTVPLKVHKK